MLNYIKAELWKVFRRKSCYVLAALLLFCAHLYGWLFSGGYFADLAAGVSLTMVTGMPLAPLLAHLVDAGSRDTLKNELSFGLSRGRIYWGKLAAGLLLGLLLALILVGGVLATGRLLLPRGDPGAAWSNLYRVGVCLLGAVPLWCGMFALCHTGPAGVQHGGMDGGLLRRLFHWPADPDRSGSRFLRGKHGSLAVSPASGGSHTVHAADIGLAERLDQRGVPALVLGGRTGLAGGQRGRGPAVLPADGPALAGKKRKRICFRPAGGLRRHAGGLSRLQNRNLPPPFRSQNVCRPFCGKSR